MAKHNFNVGDEVAVIDSDGTAWRITTIIRQHLDGEWATSGSQSECARWTKTGVSRDNRRQRQTIVPATDAHRAAVWARSERHLLARAETWRDATPEQIAAVMRILGRNVPAYVGPAQ